MLSLYSIRKSYHIGPIEMEVLKGVSLEVEQGELLSIMGASGCGKSTLMHIIGLLDRPSSGRYILNGKEVTYDDDDLLSGIRNKNIGFVFQQYQLLSRMTALENVALPLLYRGERIQPGAGLTFLERVGMGERAGHRPSELSGGQQQRVAIARALATRPALILADEPTGALDTLVGQEIMDLFKQLNTEEGITIIIITHDPNIARQCRRTVTMRDGVIEQGC